MTHLGYLLAGWIIPLGAIAIYAASVLRRGRTAARYVPAERARWMSTADE